MGGYCAEGALKGATFANAVLQLHAGVGVFLHEVVVRRTDAAVSSWRNWLLEDPLVRPYLWLRSDMVLPSFSLGVIVPTNDPALIDEEFQKAWLPYFSRSARGHSSLSDFEGEVEGWLRTSDEVDSPTMSAKMLLDVVRKKSMTAGGEGREESQGPSCILV